MNGGAARPWHELLAWTAPPPPTLHRHLTRLPLLLGSSIALERVPEPRNRRGTLVSGGTGVAVHAASYLRERRIVLDEVLWRRPPELARIVTHELWHFVWWRLGNPRREQFTALLLCEWARGECGELGWSAEWRKVRLGAADPAQRTRRWREYVCESFCDTAAWHLAAVRTRVHPEHTLGARGQARRASWFASTLGTGPFAA